MKKKMVFRLTEKERNGSDDSGNDDSGSDGTESDFAGSSDSGGPAKERKRKLTALSSAASPTSAPAAPKSPLETRHEGRLTPQSRMSVVKDMASQLNRSQNEGNY